MEGRIMAHEARFRTVAAATDFSENATAAVAWAEQIARQHGAKLVLLHATLPEVPAAPEFVQLPVSYFEELRRVVEERLEAAAAEIRRTGLAVEAEVIVGPTVQGLLDAVSRRQAELLVTGTRGRTGWKKLLLGSTAARLVRHAPCPVLTVHPTDPGPAHRVRTVLVPTDFSEDAQLAANAAFRILGPEGERRVVLVHAYRLPIEDEHLPARVLMKEIRAAEEDAHARLEAKRASLERPGVQVEGTSIEGYPADVILARAESVHPDLIAMGTHGRSGLDRLFLGSTAERVLASAPCPVLTVHRGEAS
jgi:nucleotide-binding universal stress UspA family protein